MANLVLLGQFSGRLRPSMFLAEATSFVGRTDELRRIRKLLRTARLVTLVGAGGVGKTRVCLRAAMMACDQFPDGVWLVELSGLREPALLYSAIAAAFKLPDQEAPSRREAVLNRLRDRQLLLILDTCEHLIDASATAAEDILRAAAGVTVLATSRQPLDAPGEHAFPVLPLPVQDDAVELFTQRATAVLPGFAITPGNRGEVIRLCQRLDGIPLAIELAAVRLRALPLTELTDRLEAGFGVLAVSRRGTYPRHQTLRTAIEWSYGLCTPLEQRLWARLSVFAGTFDIEAVEEVCADDGMPREEIIHALVGLIDKSVVLRSCDGVNRYRLLGTLREFGAGQLAASDDQYRTLDRLTQRCLGMAACFDGHSPDGDQAGRYRALLREYPNIRAAFEYTLGGQRPPAPGTELLGRARWGAELAVRLQAFWQISGLLNEGRHWLERVLCLFPAPASESGQAPAPERVWALGVSGRLASGIPAMEEAHTHAAGTAGAAPGDRCCQTAVPQGAELARDNAVQRALPWAGGPTDDGAATVVRGAGGGNGVTRGVAAGSARNGLGGIVAGGGRADSSRADSGRADSGDSAGGGAGGSARLPAILTRREQEIAELVASGLSNREIAARLFISKRTVDAHVEHIFGKLEISSRVQLTIMLRDQLSA